MEDRQTPEQQVEIAYRRLREALEGSGAAPEANEALAALRASCDELKAHAQEEAAGRRAAHAALAAERRLASTLLDTVGALVVVLDREGRIVRFNRMCERTTGYAFETVKGQRVWDFLLLPDEVAPAQAAFDELRSGHFPNEFESYWVARDGSRRLIAWTNTAIPGLNGSPDYIIGAGLDITEREQARLQKEAALAEREHLLEENYRQRQFLERLLEVAPVGVAVVRGPEHRYEYVNATYQAASGAPMVGRTVAEVFPEAVARGSLEGIEAAYRTGQTVSLRGYEFDVGPGRERTYWDLDRVPLKAPDGGVEGVLIVAREVTEAVLARRQVGEVAARDEAILNSLAEGIVVFDADSNVLTMNPAALRMQGSDPAGAGQARLADLAGRFKLRHPDGRSLAPEEWPIARVLRGETLGDCQAQVEHLDTGRTWFASYGGAPVCDPAGRVTMGVLTVRDITAQKQAESQREAARLERERLLAEVNAANRDLQTKNEKMEAQAEELHFQTLSLEAERARLRAIIDSAPEAILVADERGELATANPAAERLLGASTQGAGWSETMGQLIRRQPDHAAYQPHELPLFRAAVHRAVQRGIALAVARPDGQWRDVLASAVPILDSRGRSRGAVAIYQDITERLQAERTLRVALEKYRVLFESFPLGITVSDETGQILECNKEAERLLGVPQAEHTRRDIDAPEWQLIRPDGSPMPAEDYASVRALREKRLVENVEMGIVKEGDAVTWLNVTAAPIPLEGYGVVVAYGDISERVRAKQERDHLLRQTRRDRESIAGLAAILQREWDTLQAIMESTPAQLAYLDSDFNFIRVNSAYAQGFGHGQQKLIGANYFDLFPNAENQAVFERVRASGQPAAFSARPFEFAGQPEPGVTYWDWTLVPVKDGDGRVLGLVLSLLDVTVQVASRRAVEELAARDEAILNSLSEGIITIDREGNFLTINPAAPRILGFGETEQAAERFKDAPNAFEMRDLNGVVVPAESSPQARLMRGETFGGYELHVRNTATGATWIGSFSGVPVRDADGALAMGVLAVHDITVEKQAEAQRDASLEELKARLAEKEVLMREIYHRVKNNVQALIYLMDMQADHIPDENTRQTLRELQERARAMALVHEKLYQSHNLAQIDFGDYLHDLADNLVHAFGAGRPIVWRIDVENVSLSVDTAIPCGLVVSELLTNALKYAFPGGQPVAARGETECAISVTSRAEGNRITLVVADNGVGLPAGVDWTTTQTLGLQLINILACHQLGGQIEIDRSAGTSFKITFVGRTKK